MNKELQTQDWFTALVEECDAIITETISNSRWKVIEGYHELGIRIAEDAPKFEAQGIRGQEIVQCIAQAMKKSRRTVQYAIQFAKEYPTSKDLQSLPYGKNISWYKICTKVLPGKVVDEDSCDHSDVEEIRFNKCKKCGKRIPV